MLELRNIKKDYKLKDQEPVHALKGISLNFRSHEFVAILGHSGCGKTTLLNITGGLDHYDDGDLIIKNKSTKDFKSGDWDTYRNHSVGFVFQTYNLIPHQTILSNVELALTISGVKKEERVKRAKEALDAVGLAGLYKKKPNQLSGGQMQRVAIARALVNNPEIVLADEPTGALDSETSVQIMELLKEVAKSHLVIMVTHNPELANKYATRIVKMKDGLIVDDSNPFDGEEAIEVKEEPVNEISKGRKKRSSMSFLTASALSASNLLSKFKRTLLVSIAGSIGIIGVSTILGVSCGVNNYIDDMQDDMLSSYPIQVAEESLDMTSLLTGLSNEDKKEAAQFDTSTQIGMDSMIRFLLTKYTDFTNLKTNDMSKELLSYICAMPTDYYAAINVDYSIDPTNNIFTEFRKKNKDDKKEIVSINGLTQQYIATLGTVEGFSEYMQFVDIFTSFMKQLPGEQDYIGSQYDLISGHFPTQKDELLLVVDDRTTLTDLILAQMGYYPQEQFLNIAKKAVKENALYKELEDPKTTPERKIEIYQELAALSSKYPYESVFSYQEVMNHEFVYYPHDAMYSTEDDWDLVSHRTVNANFSGTTNVEVEVMPGVKVSMDLTFYLALSYVPSDDMLTGNMIVINSSTSELMFSTPVLFKRDRSFIPEHKYSVVDGRWSVNYNGMDLSVTLQCKEGTGSGNTYTYQIDNGLLELKNVEFSGVPIPYIGVPLDKGKATEVEPNTPDFFYRSNLEYEAGHKDEDRYLHPDLYPKNTGEKTYKHHGFKMKIAGILRPKETTNFGSLKRGVYFTKEFGDEYRLQAEESTIVTEFKKHLTEENYKLSQFNAYVTFEYDSYKENPDEPTLTKGYASALNGDTANTLMSIFASFLTYGSDNFDSDATHLRSLSGLKAKRVAPLDKPDEYTYTIDELPQSISIYPRSFETKDKVTAYLDRWNSTDVIPIYVNGSIEYTTRADRMTITYTDTISLIVEVISTLVTTVSAALIAFTSLSLVVSCFMIAVITYISVMERVKEIGVIRSLGGRKRDVSRLFIAENVVTGLASGAIGIGITYILQLIINLIVKDYGVGRICALPWYYALMMVGIAVVLSVISGLIPSFSASKQDPVTALRSE